MNSCIKLNDDNNIVHFDHNVFLYDCSALIFFALLSGYVCNA